MLSEGVEKHEAQTEAARDELAGICGVLNAAHAELVALTHRVIDKELWRGYGIRSVEHWLCWQAGLSPARARQIAAAARRYDELPATMSTFTAGELSVDQVAAVVTHAPAHNDAEAASFAKVATVTQLRRTLSRATHDVEPEPAAEPEPGCDPDSESDSASDSAPDPESASDAGETDAEERRRAEDRRVMAREQAGMGFDGRRFRFWFNAPPDVGELVRQAMLAAHDQLFYGDHPDVTLADAFVEVCRAYLDTSAPTSRPEQDGPTKGDGAGTTGRSPGAVGTARVQKAQGRKEQGRRHRVYVHLGVEGGWLNAGPRLPRDIVQKLTCDGLVAPVWESGGYPVNVGRSMRLVPDHTRRLVTDRDRGCVFPGCHADMFLEVHHIRHWADGGPTDTDNLVCLCPHHHDAHHRGEFALTGNPDHPGSLEFTDPHGRRILPIGRPRPPTRPLPQPQSQYRHPPGERMDLRWLHFRGPPGRDSGSAA